MCINKVTDCKSAPSGKAQEIKGYYHPDFAATSAAMRPSTTLNTIINSI